MMMLNENQVREVESIILDFPWCGKKLKIASTLMGLKERGELRSIDIRAKHDTLIICWIFRLEENELFSLCAYESHCPLPWRIDMTMQHERENSL